jgi:hypothetical protein
VVNPEVLDRPSFREKLTRFARAFQGRSAGNDTIL